MYLNILKKDFKRKKSMNLILLMFIILAATFVSGSVNNLVTITTAMDDFIERAELADYNNFSLDSAEVKQSMEKFLEEEPSVKEYRSYRMPSLTEKDITKENGKIFEYSNQIMLSNIEEMQTLLFNHENEIITTVKAGELYMPIQMMNQCEIESGEKIVIEVGDYRKSFVVHECKNLIFGPLMTGMSQITMNEQELQELTEASDSYTWLGYEIKTFDAEQFEENFNQSGIPIVISVTAPLVKQMYMMDMVKAGVLLIVSICLILISLVVLRFTISFTLNEEFREIGVMKAIGIRNGTIRLLYCSKYFVISVVGSLVGLGLGLPFGQLMLSEVSHNIPIHLEGRYYLNIICAVVVVLVIVMFCYLVTGRIKKLTPIDAIRSGSTGERYQKKGILHLSRGKMSAVSFLAYNDILSGIRRFSVMILAFTLGIILIIVPVNTTNTLSSDKLVRWFSMTESDVYLSSEAIFGDGKENDKVIGNLASIQKNLQEHGIRADVYQEMVFKYNVSFGEKSYNSLAFQGVNTKTDEYAYIDGTPPQQNNEVGITHYIGKKIGAKIGDTITIKIDDKEQQFIVTALFQTMNNMGEGIRFYQELPLDYESSFGEFGVQIRYTDEPSKQERADRLEEIAKLYPDFNVYTGGEYINQMIGGINLDSMINIITAVVLVINALVAILMVKSFIAKETGEIGMLKAIGFANSALIRWQTLRIGIILIISTILGSLLSNIIAKPTVGMIFQMMGAYSIEFEIKPLEVYLFYPLLVFVVTIAASLLSTQQVRRISASETSNIE